MNLASADRRYLSSITPPKDLLELERVLGKFQFFAGNVPDYAVHVSKLLEKKKASGREAQATSFKCLTGR